MSTLPPAIVHFRDLLLLHLQKLLRVDQVTTRYPMHSVALVVMVGYETFANCLDPVPTTKRTSHWLFARYHADRYGPDVTLGQRIFDALRNGLAHAYSQYPIPVDDLSEVRLILTWKDGRGRHAPASSRGEGRERATATRAGSGASRPGPSLVCVDVGSLCADFEVVVKQIETSLASDASVRVRFEALLGGTGRGIIGHSRAATRPSGADSRPSVASVLPMDRGRRHERSDAMSPAQVQIAYQGATVGTALRGS